MPQDPSLSRRERQIMDVIYAATEATAQEVATALPDPPSKTAVRTMLRILEDKGVLKHTKRGREFVYAPVRPRRRAGLSAFQHVLQTFFNDSLENALAAHFENSRQPLTPEEYERLSRMINDARQKK